MIPGDAYKKLAQIKPKNLFQSLIFGLCDSTYPPLIPILWNEMLLDLSTQFPQFIDILNEKNKVKTAFEEN